MFFLIFILAICIWKSVGFNNTPFGKTGFMIIRHEKSEKHHRLN